MGTYVLAMVDGERKLLMQGDMGVCSVLGLSKPLKQCLIGLWTILRQQQMAQGLCMLT